MYNIDGKIEKTFNAILSDIAMPWILSDEKGLYLDGFFYENIQSINDQLVLKLSLALRQNKQTFNSTGCLNPLHSKFTEEGNFDVQVAINNCAVNELMFTLFYID